MKGKKTLEVVSKGELSLSGNSEEFLGSPEGPLEVCGHNFKVKLLSIWCTPPLLSYHHIQMLRTTVKDERTGVALVCKGIIVVELL